VTQFTSLCDAAAINNQPHCVLAMLTQSLLQTAKHETYYFYLRTVIQASYTQYFLM